jgi:hypothetical protein
VQAGRHQLSAGGGPDAAGPLHPRVRADRGWRECSHQFFGRGDGALVSTAADLAVFFRALLVERRLLPEGLLHQMMSVLPDDPPAAKSYGFGLIADPMPCGAV